MQFRAAEVLLPPRKTLEATERNERPISRGNDRERVARNSLLPLPDYFEQQSYHADSLSRTPLHLTMRNSCFPERVSSSLKSTALETRMSHDDKYLREVAWPRRRFALRNGTDSREINWSDALRRIGCQESNSAIRQAARNSPLVGPHTLSARSGMRML